MLDELELLETLDELEEMLEEDELEVEIDELDELLLEVLILEELDDDDDDEVEIDDELELVEVSISPPIPDLNANSDIFLSHLRYRDIGLTGLSTNIHSHIWAEGEHDLVPVFHYSSRFGEDSCPS